MLEYLKFLEDRLIDIFSTSSITRKINNPNNEEFLLDKPNEEFKTI